MRLIHLSTGATILLDIAAWMVIHLAVALRGSQLPLHRFDPSARLFRPWRWEHDGAFYAHTVHIGSWKELLPDGAPLLGRLGFPKRRLADTSSEYLANFVGETCRAELVHWIILSFAPLFFFWNRPSVGALMIVYAAVENLPLIATQRYNRLRLQRILAKRKARDAR
jgi:glycosyl-4,4'-diaponeurosporenoate acyltransferase